VYNRKNIFQNLRITF